MSNRNIAALVIGLIMILWLASGVFSTNSVLAELNPAAEATQEQPLVRAQMSRASLQELILEVRGLTQPNRVVEVRAEISGKIEAIPAEKGFKVQEGDLLCQIAVDARQSELNEARAEEKQARLEFDGIKNLDKHGLQSSINIARSAASLEAARTRVKKAELALEKTRILAPFGGVVFSQPVEVGDFMTPGSICVSLMELDPVLVVGQVAEKNIGAVRLGDKVDIQLITGQKLNGTVSYIAFSPEKQTRSYPVEVTVGNPDGLVISGITSEMHVPLGVEQAHLISPASLVLDDHGQMGVRVVEDNNMVHFYPVSILKEAEGGIWIGGLPSEVKLITLGQEEVFDGQQVRVDLIPLLSQIEQSPDLATKIEKSP